MDYRKVAQEGSQAQQQHQQQVMGVDPFAMPTLASGQGFYTLESLQVLPSASQNTHQEIYPQGTGYGSYGLASDGTLSQGLQLHSSAPSDLTGSYGSMQQHQQQGVPYFFPQQHQQQGIAAELAPGTYDSRASMYSADPALNPTVHGPYVPMSPNKPPGHDIFGNARMATGSMQHPRHPLENHFAPQEGYAHAHAHLHSHAPWFLEDSVTRFQQQQARLGSSVAPHVPVLSSYEWPPKREPVREYVGHSLSYVELGNPSRSQMWKPGSSGTTRKTKSPFKGFSALHATKTNINMKPSKQHEPVVHRRGGPGWCSVCQVDCNTKDILEQHYGGKKHKKQLEKREANLTVQKKSDEINMKQLASGNQESNLKEDDKNVTQIPSVNGLMENKENQNGTFGNKLEADQHQDMTENSQHPNKIEKSGGEVSDSNTGKRKLKAKATDDIGTKRQRLLDAGTAVAEVKVCTLCNAVCNSQIVFDSHLAGKKHVAQVKKLEEEAKGMSKSNDHDEKPIADAEQEGKNGE